MSRIRGQEEEVTRNGLCGSWVIFQLRRGHRFNTDDVLVAWTAAAARPAADRLLDLGSGVGSIGLLTLRRLGPNARLTAVEVQQVSAALARRTVAENGLQARVEVRRADLRDPDAVPDGPRYALITANPPYLPPQNAVAPAHPQRAAARLELHGDVSDYCRVAARHLADGGRFCFCHAARDPRPEPAIEQAGLQLLGRREVFFRQDRPPSIALFVCGHQGQRHDPEPLTIRDREGRWTEPYLAIRETMELIRPHGLSTDPPL